MMSESPTSLPLDILGIGVALPTARRSLEAILAEERVTADAQLAGLSRGLRDRLQAQLGIESVATASDESSTELAERAASEALRTAGLEPQALGLILDFSTAAVDCPEIWSLSHHLQGKLGATQAFALSTRGSGCAGLHLALLVAQTFLLAHPTLEYVLLVASDRAPEGGRCCLPISIMADAATAMVVSRSALHRSRFGRLLSVAMKQYGKFADVLVMSREPPSMKLDVARFEQQVLPLHFVMTHRSLSRACTLAGVPIQGIESIVYPNTTELDRNGIARGLGLAPGKLVGAGPKHVGHAFANDLLINAACGKTCDGELAHGPSAWLASGSGFTWGAAIVELGG